MLNAANGPPGDISEVLAKLKDNFETANQVAIDALDVDGNAVLNNSEAPALFDLLDTDSDGTIDRTEQNAALADGFTGQVITTTAQLVAVLNAPRGPPADFSGVLAKLKDSFETDNQIAIDALDVDGNDVLNSSEAPALFDLLDTVNDGTIGEAEQDAALVGGYTGQIITTAAQLVAVLNASPPPDDYLNISEVLAKLKDTFETDNQTAIDALDVDGNDRLNNGFEVNTGDPAAPVVLDFDHFLVSIQLGGEIELNDVFRLYGVFLFEADTSSLKAFVAAGLEIGPDIGSTSKIFNMNALGALVINADGVAADIDVSISIGGALSDFIELNANARLVFNTTGDDLEIEIPAQYVAYLLGNSPRIRRLRFLAGQRPEHDAGRGRFVKSIRTGSATFTISGTAPGDISEVLAKLKDSFEIDNQIAIDALDVDGNDLLDISEASALFDLLDTTSDGTIDEAEQDAALAGGYTGQLITTAAQLVAVLNANPPGPYLLATFDADLTIMRTFVIEADFELLVTGDTFEMTFAGSLDLGGFGRDFDVAGGVLIDDNGFALYGDVDLDINLRGAHRNRRRHFAADQYRHCSSPRWRYNH